MTVPDARKWFEWLFHEESEYDLFGNTEEFAIRVLSTPTSDPALSTKYIFMGRIIPQAVPSPHDVFLWEPCDLSIAANEAEATQIIALHTRFTMYADTKPAFGIGDVVYALFNPDLPTNDGGYDLQFAHIERVGYRISSSPLSSTSVACNSLAKMMKNQPPISLGGMMTAMHSHAGASTPTNVRPAANLTPDVLPGVTTVNMLGTPIGRSKYGWSGTWEQITLHYDQAWSVSSGIQAMAAGGKGYHFQIAKDGTIRQLEKLDTPIYHDSAHEHGGPSYNSKAIGIALNNYGYYHGDAPFSPTGKFADFKQGPHPHDAKSIRWWQPYTAAQTKAVVDLVRALKAEFPSISAVKGHSDSSGVITKKPDPGPLFDMSVFSGIV